LSRHFTSIISNTFGKFANKEFSPKIQKFINDSYIKLMGLDMSRFENSDNYKSLKDLFIRPIKDKVNIDARVDSVISPCDSRVIALGTITDNTAYQIKGMSYNTNELIDASNNSKILEGGEYINFYLSPKDYHRYHMPFDVEVLSATYIPGKLYPVNMPLLKNKKNLYIENERVVLEVIDRFDHKHFIVLVGALNVGKMVVTFESAIKTNAKEGKARYTYDTPKKLKKGEMFGWFEMGSTIVMLSQKDAIKYSIKEGVDVKYSEIIGELNDN